MARDTHHTQAEAQRVEVERTHPMVEEGQHRPGMLERARQGMSEDNVPLVAAGVAFYIFLGIIPGLAALISVYGLLTDEGRVQQHLQYLSSILPAETQVLEQEILQIATDQAVAGWGAFVGLLFMLWSGSKATKALIAAINLAYGCRERRGFFKLTLLSLGLTLSGVLFGAVAIALIGVVPAVLSSLGLDAQRQTLLVWLRWPLLVIFFLTAVAVLYRYAPDRAAVRWQWVSLGAVAAGLLWVGGSLLMSWYVAHFADYSKTYGSLGAVVLLLLWLYLTAFALIAGAELNSAREEA